MLTNPLVFLLVLALPLFFGQLGVVNAFCVPLGVRRLEVSPHAVGFFVLAARGAVITGEVLLIGFLHDELEGKESWIV